MLIPDKTAISINREKGKLIADKLYSIMRSSGDVTTVPIDVCNLIREIKTILQLLNLQYRYVIPHVLVIQT